MKKSVVSILTATIITLTQFSLVNAQTYTRKVDINIPVDSNYQLYIYKDNSSTCKKFFVTSDGQKIPVKKIVLKKIEPSPSKKQAPKVNKPVPKLVTDTKPPENINKTNVQTVPVVIKDVKPVDKKILNTNNESNICKDPKNCEFNVEIKPKEKPVRPETDFAEYLKITKAYGNFNKDELALFNDIGKNFSKFKSRFTLQTNLSNSQIATIAQVATAYNPVYSFAVDYRGNTLEIYNIKYLESPEFIEAENLYLDALIDSIPKNLNQIEQIYYVIKNISNFTFVHNTDNTNPLDPKNANGISVQIGYSLLNGGGVCSGFTDLTNKAMEKMGIPYRQVFGYLRTTPHTWSQIKIDDNWYNIETSAFSSDYDGKKFYGLDTFLVSNDSPYFSDYHTFDREVFKTPSKDYLEANPKIKSRLLKTFSNDYIIDNGKVDKDGYRDLVWNVSDTDKY